MDEKKSIRFTLLFLLGIYLIFAVASMAKTEDAYSLTEERPLASKPVAEKKAIVEGTFQTAYETYVEDQMAGREKFLGLRAFVDVLLNKKRTDTVYFGKNQYLFEIHLQQEFPDSLAEQQLSALENLAETENATVILLPTSAGFYSEYLPLNAPSFSQKTILDEAGSLLGEEHFIDGRTVLGDKKEEYLYCRSEQIITGLAAYYFYAPWCSITNTSRYPYNKNILQTAAENVAGALERETETGESFDTILYQKETLKYKVRVLYPDGTTGESVYDEAALLSEDPFDYYLGGKKGITVIRTDSKHQKTLVMATGDNGLTFVPYLLSHFDKIVICNGISGDTLREQIAACRAENEDTQVLAFYDVVELLQEFDYGTVGETETR